MAVSDRTFSFRAPSEFAARLTYARKSLEQVAASELSGDLSQTFELELLRRTRALGDEATEGTFVRAVAEALVTAVERIRRDQDLMPEFERFAAEDVEGDAWRAATSRAWLARD